MKKRNSSVLNKKTKMAIIVVVIAVFMVIISIVMRQTSYTQTWLVCEIDQTEQYHEILKFRYDIDNKLYGYYREERLHSMSEELLEANYKERKAELDRVSDSLSDNFQYEVYKNNDEILIKTYIGVSVFPNFFNNYIKNDNITNTTSLEDVQKFLEYNKYTCNVSRK